LSCIWLNKCMISIALIKTIGYGFSLSFLWIGWYYLGTDKLFSYNLLSSKHFRSFFLDHFGSNILGLNMFFVRINISTFRFSPSKKFLQLLYGPKVVIKIFIGTKSWRKILEGPKQKFSIFIETKNIFNPTF